jgi:glycosyltransferase involved in cell wall biosynthesis
MMAISRWSLTSTAYTFSGIENPLAAPRYPWARMFSTLFDRWHLNSAARADVLFAAADHAAILRLAHRSKGVLQSENIISSPTSFDSTCFKIKPKGECRNALGFADTDSILVVSGRVSAQKGWGFILDSFSVFKKSHPKAKLVFVGDGEDSALLQQKIEHKQLSDSVSVVGFQPPEYVSLFLNASDAVLLGSLHEGWPTALVEALACGKPVVSTRVSGASSLIKEGLNGFVLDGRNPDAFADAIDRALHLPDAHAVSTQIAEQYSLEALTNRLEKHWPVLACGNNHRVHERISTP